MVCKIFYGVDNCA